MNKKRKKKKIYGTPDKPRLTVFKSARHIYGQVIDDTTRTTLVAASTLDKGLSIPKDGNKKEEAKAVGYAIAEKALAKKIEKIVFDRNGFIYHGRLKALADAAREKGLKF
ncbi:50S ribosomal protein L18 [bacterium]|nr:50S ribosomal protein L18 [bacterium]